MPLLAAVVVQANVPWTTFRSGRRLFFFFFFFVCVCVCVFFECFFATRDAVFTSGHSPPPSLKAGQTQHPSQTSHASFDPKQSETMGTSKSTSKMHRDHSATLHWHSQTIPQEKSQSTHKAPQEFTWSTSASLHAPTQRDARMPDEMS